MKPAPTYNRNISNILKENLYLSDDYKENLKKYAEDINYSLNKTLDNTAVIAERVAVNIEFGEFKFPTYNMPENFQTIEDYLEFLVMDGLKNRFQDEIFRKIQRKS